MTETDVNRLFSFSIGSHFGDDTAESIASKKQRAVRDPMSHRIIEKRRRDRMNNCLADLSQLIPATFMKQGQGRIEKTEIIEMAIRHIKYLQSSNTSSLLGDNIAVTSKEMLLKGYQECQSDTFGFLEDAGYSPTESLFLSLKAQLDSNIAKLKTELASFAQSSPAKEAPPVSESLPPFTSAGCPTQLSHLSRPSSSIASSSLASSTCASSRDDQSFGGGISAGGGGVVPSDRLLPNQTPKEDYLHHEVTASQRRNHDSGLGSSLAAGPVTSETSDENKSSTSGFVHCRGDLTAVDSSRPAAYKFKQDIQQRFISHVSPPENNKRPAEATNPVTKASNKISVQVTEAKEDFKDPQLLLPERTDVTNNYPSNLSYDNGSAYGSGSSVNSFRSTHSSNSQSNMGNSQEISLNNTVPAFALHPMGYFYIPVVLPISQVMPFIAGHKSMGVCHPVSIPVSFTGPFPIGGNQEVKGGHPQGMPAGIGGAFSGHQLGRTTMSPLTSMGGGGASGGPEFNLKITTPSSEKSKSSDSPFSHGTSRNGPTDSKKNL